MTIVENLQRADLNPMEQARAYQRLSRVQDDAGADGGADRRAAGVGGELPEVAAVAGGVQGKVERASSFGHARTLLALESPEAIVAAAQKVLALSMSVRQTETYVQGLLNPEAKEKKEQPEEVVGPECARGAGSAAAVAGAEGEDRGQGGQGPGDHRVLRLEDFDAILTALGDTPGGLGPRKTESELRLGTEYIHSHVQRIMMRRNLLSFAVLFAAWLPPR